jgi:methylated-DNA-[protein]-cysteine S-methyltransferase
MASTAQHIHIFETTAGFCGIAWSRAGVCGFRLPGDSAETTQRHLLRRLPDATPATPPASILSVIAAAKRYFAGEAIDFTDVPVDLDGQQDFSQRIYGELRQVGWGRTTTYGTLAKALGAGPEAARDVGQAMAKNPVPLIIPCHRVLAAGGKVGGFSAPGGSVAKARMLELEGVSLAPPPPAQQSLGF